MNVSANIGQQECVVFCQTPASWGRKAEHLRSKGGDNSAIWDVWYLDSTLIPPQLQNQ